MTHEDDGERRCESCAESFNLIEGGVDYVIEWDGPICSGCVDDES